MCLLLGISYKVDNTLFHFVLELCSSGGLELLSVGAGPPGTTTPTTDLSEGLLPICLSGPVFPSKSSDKATEFWSE